MKKNRPFLTMCFTCTDAKSGHLEFSWLTGFEQWETNLIFQKPLICHCVKYDSVLHALGHERKMSFFELSVSPELMQTQVIWNFHGSLTLNNGKLIGHFRSLWYVTHFDHNALFSALEVNFLFKPNVGLANILPVEYSDEYLAGWYLVN